MTLSLPDKTEDPEYDSWVQEVMEDLADQHAIEYCCGGNAREWLRVDEIIREHYEKGFDPYTCSNSIAGYLQGGSDDHI